MDERETGQLIAEVKNLKDAVKSIQERINQILFGIIGGSGVAITILLEQVFGIFSKPQ